MTPLQQSTLDLINDLNVAEFDGWFLPSEVMAFVQIESAFRPHAYRYEPRLKEASFGLMQVLASTAEGIDPSLTDPARMYDPKTGLRIGMRVARAYWDQLEKRLGQEPTYEEWCDSYNRGVGGVMRIIAAGEEPDDAYTAAWIKAREFWEAQGIDE